MKLAIEHEAVKRSIDGPFEICGSSSDLLRVAECIRNALEGGMAYGWVTIADKVPSCPPNTPPIGWKERG